jgi:hypothetical protein
MLGNYFGFKAPRTSSANWNRTYMSSPLVSEEAEGNYIGFILQTCATRFNLNLQTVKWKAPLFCSYCDELAAWHAWHQTPLRLAPKTLNQAQRRWTWTAYQSKLQHQEMFRYPTPVRSFFYQAIVPSFIKQSLLRVILELMVSVYNKCSWYPQKNNGVGLQQVQLVPTEEKAPVPLCLPKSKTVKYALKLRKTKFSLDTKL